MSTKRKVFTIILIIMLIGIFAGIFMFSSQNAEKSKRVSRTVTQVVTKPIQKMQELEGVEKEQAISNADAIVRKIAHFSLYMIVGATAMGIMVVGTNTKQRTKVICAMGVGIIYAISDEIHQTFTLGRTGLATDVVIDSMRCVNRDIAGNDNCKIGREEEANFIDTII